MSRTYKGVSRSLFKRLKLKKNNSQQEDIKFKTNKVHLQKKADEMQGRIDILSDYVADLTNTWIKIAKSKTTTESKIRFFKKSIDDKTNYILCLIKKRQYILGKIDAISEGELREKVFKQDITNYY